MNTNTNTDTANTDDTDRAFAAWLTELDIVLTDLIGLVHRDLPDLTDLWDLWESGWSPTDGAQAIMEDLEYGF